jgi:hypothetical protein
MSDHARARAMLGMSLGRGCRSDVLESLACTV